ncbi:MAG: hypothetical protein ACK41U_15720 [Paracoccus sp. (in: a-proteobacteria)]|uniref:hypothetical protein n=1 Tax=Paracoccus sp. TaxID=267 RepID=UPI00391C1A79
MNIEQRACATDTGLSNRSAPCRTRVAGLPAGTRDRLALFAEWTGADPFPPERIVEAAEDGHTFTDDFLRYCNDNGLSLDWVWLADERGLVIAAYDAAKGRDA